MSVINQVLHDLDARKRVRPTEPTAWKAEPEAVSERPRRLRPITLSVPVLAIAMVALFGQNSWGVKPDTASTSGAVGSVTPSTQAPMMTSMAPTSRPASGDQSAQADRSAPAERRAAPVVDTIAGLRALKPVTTAPVKANTAAGATTASQPILPLLALAATPAHVASAPASAPSPVPNTGAVPQNQADKPLAANALPAPGAQIDRVSLGPLATGRADGEYRSALSRYHAGQLDEAARLLQSALREDPRHIASRQALAAMLIDRRDYGQAQKILLDGLTLEPTQASFATMAARLLVRGGNLETAAGILRAAAVDHAPAELQAALADVLSRLRRDPEALEHWNAALQRNPGHAGWWLGLAVSLEASGRGPDARTAFERALALPGLKGDAADYARERIALVR